MFRTYVEQVDIEEFSSQFPQRFYNEYLGQYTPYTGIDGRSAEELIDNPRSFIKPVIRQILTPTTKSLSRFSFQPFQLKHIPKAPNTTETRPISKGTIKSLIAQVLMANYMTPVVEVRFLPSSFGYRKGKSAKQAVRLVRDFIKDGYTVVLDADIQKFFDNVDHHKLTHLVQGTFPGDELLETLIYRFIKTGYIDQGSGIQDLPGRIRSKRRGYVGRLIGIPQGGVLSPLLANLYLHPFDELMAQRFPHLPYFRYADDFIVLGKNTDEMQAVYHQIDCFLQETLSLCLHPLSGEKTRIIDMEFPIGKTTPFVDFLGYRICKDSLKIQPKNIVKFKARTRQIIRKWLLGDIEQLVSALNTRLEGHYWQVKDDGSAIFLGRNWCRYFSLVSDIGIFRHLDNWTLNEIQDTLKDRLGVSFSKQRIKEKGLKTLVRLHFQMIEDGRRQTQEQKTGT